MTYRDPLKPSERYRRRYATWYMMDDERYVDLICRVDVEQPNPSQRHLNVVYALHGA